MEFVETKVNVVTGPHLYYELGAFTIEGHFGEEFGPFWGLIIIYNRERLYRIKNSLCTKRASVSFSQAARGHFGRQGLKRVKRFFFAV